MAAMKALHILAGPRARQHIARHGLQPSDVGVVPAAAGGPKGLILGPLDRFIFGQWLPRSSQPVHLVGASIGAWRMATACLDGAVAAFERLERDYIYQEYEIPPGKKRPSPAHVSARFGRNLEAFYGGRVDEVLAHPRYRLHIVTSRGRHLLGRERPLTTPIGYLGAFMANTMHRKAMGAWLERVVFSSTSQGGGPVRCAALPFATRDYRTRQVGLNADNFMPALQASCSIPFVLQAVHDIPGAPRGAYWDGGITDYHLHLEYRTHLLAENAIENIANSAIRTSAGCENSSENSDPGGLVLYPHFQHQLVPGWLDKPLKWRHRATPALDDVVVLSPNPDWVRTLPNAKLPDRSDFIHYGTDTAARVKVWQAAVSASQQLVDEWVSWLESPDISAVQAL
jgi:hypothetical protein